MKVLIKLSLLATLAVPIVAGAQEAEKEGTVNANQAEERDGAAVDQAGDRQNAEKTAEIEQKLKAQDEEIHKLHEKDAKRDEELKELNAKVEQLEFEGISSEDEFEDESRFLSFWGFFDLTLMKRWYDEGSYFDYYISSPTSFTMTNVNLYAKSQLTRTFRVLMETSLSFLPSVQDEELEMSFLPDSAYSLADMEVIDPKTTEKVILDGIKIERLYMQWEPVDWFNVLAGRYLTPYGIWNIDHGSPVVLIVSLPYMQVREIMIKAQTGLQFYGRLFPGDLVFDYAVTLSNGAGPTQAVFDLDENKAVGLKLHLAYEKPDFSLSGGAYGYYGSGLYQKKVVSYDPNTTPAFGVNRVDTADFDELGVALDAKLTLFGFLLQGEYIRKWVDYKQPEMMDPLHAIFAKGTLAGPAAYTANYMGNSFYCLIAYTLPLDKWIKPVITPYFYVERTIQNDTEDYLNIQGFLFGVNVKPEPFLTLKAEYNPFESSEGDTTMAAQQLSFQMAVSF